MHFKLYRVINGPLYNIRLRWRENVIFFTHKDNSPVSGNYLVDHF